MDTGNQPPTDMQTQHSAWWRRRRTSDAFVAEYSVMLIALGILLSNIAWLVTILFGLTMTAAYGSVQSLDQSPQFILWLVISSVFAIPTVAFLWRRTHGELAANEQYNGTIPKGGARGFRTLWLVGAGLLTLFFVIFAAYAPLNAAVSGISPLNALIAQTIPLVASAAIATAGMWAVIKGTRLPNPHVLLGIITFLIVALFIADYIWATNLTRNAPITPHSSTPTLDPNDF